MNPRERFLQVASFGNPDKIPLAVGGPRPLTRTAWIKQGMPPDADLSEYLGYAGCTISSRSIASFPGEGFEWKPDPLSINIGPSPPFEHKLLKEDSRYRVWVDCLGITQMGFQHDWREEWSGFATRVFIDFPVKSGDDFAKIKRRYDPDDPARYPKDWDRLAREYKDRSYPLGMTIRGPFWWTRDMIGLKGIATGIYRDRELLRDIIDLCVDFQTRVLHRALDSVELDYVIISEDMAYKNGPMIGPDAVRDFMGEAYREFSRFFLGHGVAVVFIDSDGDIESLIPVWEDCGINGVTPCEVAAGMDVVRLGRRHPRLVMMGGIDKRMLARSFREIDEEVDYKVPPLLRRRGFFPGVDHAVPPDVPLNNFRYFVRRLKELCGWTTPGAQETIYA